MSNELINYDELGIEQKDDKAVAELTKAGDYLPQVRVFGSESKIVKEGKFPMGHFGLYYSADKIADLSDQVDVLVIAYRPRASIMTEDQPINYFDPDTDNFNKVKSKALEGVQGYMAGLEYLLWIPSVKQFAIFFMGSKTLRRESSNVRGFRGKAATLKIKLIKTAKYTWHGCETLSCDAPFDVPPNEKIKEVFESKFSNAEDSSVSVTDESSDRVR